MIAYESPVIVTEPVDPDDVISVSGGDAPVTDIEI